MRRLKCVRKRYERMAYLGMTMGSGVGHTDDAIESKLLDSLSMSVVCVSRFADDTYEDRPDVEAPHVFGSASTLFTKVVANDCTFSTFVVTFAHCSGNSVPEVDSSTSFAADASKLASDSVP